jgi:hypothetical protein
MDETKFSFFFRFLLIHIIFVNYTNLKNCKKTQAVGFENNGKGENIVL